MICGYCNQTVTKNRMGDWVHPEGGSWAVVCLDCGWNGAPFPSVVVCPECGSKHLRDHHYALPVRRGRR